MGSGPVVATRDATVEVILQGVVSRLDAARHSATTGMLDPLAAALALAARFMRAELGRAVIGRPVRPAVLAVAASLLGPAGIAAVAASPEVPSPP